ncbi:MAG: hypothetical protein IK130_09190 [Oscillospiraceae bacterium]|nr:hypothetical protein [Oscillospiraceae bacterium]
MGIFARLFKKKIGKETEQAVRLLTKWENSHFRLPDDAQKTQDPSGTDPRRYAQYTTEAGETVSLTQIALPVLLQTPPPEGLIAKIKAIFAPTQYTMLPALIVQYRIRLVQTLRTFRANAAKLPQLGDILKEDTIFEDIDRLFSEKLRLLYHELMFCQPEQMGNQEYFFAVTGRFDSIMNDLDLLNRDASEYMYALVSAGHGDSGHALDMIRMRVIAMKDAVREMENMH